MNKPLPPPPPPERRIGGTEMDWSVGFCSLLITAAVAAIIALANHP